MRVVNWIDVYEYAIVCVYVRQQLSIINGQYNNVLTHHTLEHAISEHFITDK